MHFQNWTKTGTLVILALTWADVGSVLRYTFDSLKGVQNLFVKGIAQVQVPLYVAVRHARLLFPEPSFRCCGSPLSWNR